ncbi:diguanylate cyclase [Halocella sp. SP3-1]|uniref:diguanylate cyclase domain-containing protein n=1 Tax=Halocella sp. SP3-1 TaxID=2382161 RepID=UPI000F751E78|nr:diguanylate cyclase [Halocella sp. SP3-1]AZO96351.1 diguanylate cyclase [Halocella sp. SP3-1]
MEIKQQELLSIYERSFHYIPLAMVVLDAQGEVVLSNAGFEEMFGYSELDSIGQDLSELIVPPDLHHENETLLELAAGKKEFKESTIRSRKDGTEIAVLIRGYPFKVSAKKSYMLNIYQSLSQLTEVKAEESQRFFHDRLTGLYNRNFLEEEIKRLDHKRYLPFSIVIGDVNGLKLTNDVFGHKTGDNLLKEIARIIQQSSRQGDLIGRWGGDEFIIILPGTSYKEAEKLLERINKKEVRLEGVLFKPAICFGIATKLSEEERFERVLKKADENMYEKKLINRPKFEELILKELLNKLHADLIQFRKYLSLVIRTADKFGQVLGFNDSKLRKIRKLAKYYDIGRVNPETAGDNYKISEAGYNIAKNLNELAPIAEEILTIRENWDGSGGPYGLKGEEIPYQARMLAVVDYYYRHSLHNNRQVIKELKSLSGNKFDPQLVRVFLEQVLAEK